MKVLMILSNSFNPDPRVYKEARSLIRAGYSVSLICWDRDCNLPNFEEVNGILVYRVRTSKVVSGNFKSMLFNIFKFHRKAFLLACKLGDFDFVHCHDFDTFRVGYKLKKKFKVPLVYDVHDLYYTWIKNKFLSFIIKKLDIYYAKKADKLITVTESLGLKQNGLKEYYSSYGVKKITVLWNYPSDNNFPVKAHKGKKTICYIGNIRSLENFRILFEAAGKDYKFLIAGDGVCLNDVKKISKGFDVTFVGKFPYSDIHKYYNKSDISFSMMGKRENDSRAVSTKTFEAAYFGVPVICSLNTLDADFVEKYGLGVSCEFSVEGIKEGLKKIKSIKPKKFVWESQERKLVSIYGDFG